MLPATSHVRQIADALRPALGLGEGKGQAAPDLELAQFAAKRHRVGPLLHRAWDKGRSSPMDGDRVHAFLAREAMINVRRELQQKAATRKLTSILASAGIGCSEVKGWQLGQELYPESCLRQSKDVDLLLSPENFEAALKIAADKGYRIAGGTGAGALRRARTIARYHREVSVVDPASGVELELHSRLLQYPPEGWVDPAPEADISIRNPDYVLYILVHGSMCGWHRLKWLCDLVMLTQKVERDTREEVLEKARQFGCIEAVEASVLFMSDLWDDGLADVWLAQPGQRQNSEVVEGHLAAFGRLLGTEWYKEWRPIRWLRHAGVLKRPPIFAEEPSRFRQLRDNAMLSLLWKL